MIEFIFFYIAFINSITFIVYSIDKLKALRNNSRISERELHTFSLIGGFLGATLSMAIFKHKVSKTSFLLIHISIMIIWILVITIYVIENNK